MNADVVRQRTAASGKLFDFLGNSSMGNLPRAELVIKDPRKGVPAVFPQDAVKSSFMGTNPFPSAEDNRLEHASSTPAVALSNKPPKELPLAEGQNFLNQGAVNPV